MSRFRERIRANPLLNTTWRIGVFTFGVAIVLAGLIMVVGPGPGPATIFVGLAILATEFVWAKRVLHRVRLAMRRAKAAVFDPRVRRRNQIIAVVLGLLLAAGIAWYLHVYGLAPPWRP